MKKLLIVLIVVCGYSSNAQMFDDRGVDNEILRIPEQQTVSTAAIAEFVNHNFVTDRKKVRAIYTWVAANIRYDTDSANVINLGTDPEAKITAALRRRKGVCENYAAIFNDICIKCGVSSFVVEGYTKQNGFVDKAGHSWCAVFIDNTWLLCDPTWDAGVNNIKFFLIPPSEMIVSHMPFDPLWQLLDHPINHRQFYEGNTSKEKNQPLFNYSDSIATYIAMDSLQKLRTSAYRIQKIGLYNNMVKNRYEFNRMHIEMIRQDKDVDLYNSSVADLNDVTNSYNNFVQYRNKQFMPIITDADLRELLVGLDIKIFDAYKKIDEIAASAATFQFSTEELKQKLDNMFARINEQNNFLNLYLRTAKPGRASLFYNR